MAAPQSRVEALVDWFTQAFEASVEHVFVPEDQAILFRIYDPEGATNEIVISVPVFEDFHEDIIISDLRAQKLVWQAVSSPGGKFEYRRDRVLRKL